MENKNWTHLSATLETALHPEDVERRAQVTLRNPNSGTIRIVRFCFGADSALRMKSTGPTKPTGLIVLHRSLLPTTLEAFHDKRAHPEQFQFF